MAIILVVKPLLPSCSAKPSLRLSASSAAPSLHVQPVRMGSVMAVILALPKAASSLVVTLSSSFALISRFICLVALKPFSSSLQIPYLEMMS